MAGLGPAIHVFLANGTKDVDARHPSPPRLRRATDSLGRRSFSEDGKAGHDYGRDMNDDQRKALLEYLKQL